MKMNYQDWFYHYHRYLTSDSGDYQDTKWVNLHERYENLLDFASYLIDNQPFGVIGNDYGFDQLLSLLAESNYSFEDINDSLIKTYQQILQNAMSKMMVNTQSVIFHTKSNDTSHVYFDRMTKYYIIDLPFYQMHFGDRDEFIRQKIHEMHETENDHYVPIHEFNQKHITEILGFTILCSINGHICNDCEVAFSDKGFKFKVGWRYASDADIIIYKLDEAEVYQSTIEIDDYYINSRISYEKLGLQKAILKNRKCIVDIYDANFKKTTLSVPNFGIFKEDGLYLMNLQSKTKELIQRLKSSKITIVIYVIKYLYEIPNLYPAINYMDMMNQSLIYTDHHNPVVTLEGNKIIASSFQNKNDLEICTPPIAISHDDTKAFVIMKDCMNLREQLYQLAPQIQKLGDNIASWKLKRQLVEYPDRYFKSEITDLAKTIASKLLIEYHIYQQGAYLTSLIDQILLQRFESVIHIFDQISEKATPDTIQKYADILLYETNYSTFVTEITQPFYEEKMHIFQLLNVVSENYFPIETPKFYHPISNQCFIALRYHEDEDSWLFDYPDIQQFHGIDNVFYINQGLHGNELYKFFILYTDSFTDQTDTLPQLTTENVLDFDLFTHELQKHIGYIRYWYAENKLMKIANMTYHIYDDHTVTQTLSKILKHKIDGSDILNEYASKLNYEASNVTSDYVNAYSATSERAPFTINFLFYTLQYLAKHRDRMNDFFMKALTNQKYERRYTDLMISPILDSIRLHTNYGCFSLVSDFDSIDLSNAEGSEDCCRMFYGIPIPNTLTSSAYTTLASQSYRYTFHCYDHDERFYQIQNNDIINTSYVTFKNHPSQFQYQYDLQLAKLVITNIRDVRYYISELETNYRKTYRQIYLLQAALETLTHDQDCIYQYYNEHTDQFHHQTAYLSEHVAITSETISSIIQSHLSILKRIQQYQIEKTVQDTLKALKYIYTQNGFDQDLLSNARNLYLHLKKIFNILNPYEMKQFLLEIDESLLTELIQRAMTTEYPIHELQIAKNRFESIKRYVPALLDQLQTSNHTMNQSIQDQILQYQVQFVDDVLRYYVFDLYVLDHVEYTPFTLNTKPYYASFTCQKDDHFIPNYGLDPHPSTITLFFHPYVQEDQGIYHVKNIQKIAEYAFFKEDTITGSMIFYDRNGNHLQTINCSLLFKKIGSTADICETFKQLLHICDVTNHDDGERSIQINNVHGNDTLYEDTSTLATIYRTMNYELLAGNHFTQLSHHQELVLDPNTWTQGPIDYVHLSQQKINQWMNQDYAAHPSYAMYFKPVQVLHITPNDHIITSIGGRYFVGQTLYAKIPALQYYFPIIVTAIDHNQSKGMIEATVDHRNASWISMHDYQQIHQYLNQEIECEIMDDNVSNFLSEYHHSNYSSYPIIQSYQNEEDITNYTLLGDPVYVNQNANYVYHRLQRLFSNDEDNKYQYHMQYIDSTAYLARNENAHLSIRLLNQHRYSFSKPELYPVLRSEPNDHDIWKLEIQTFRMKMETATRNLHQIETQLNQLYNESISEENSYQSAYRYQLQYQNLLLKKQKQEEMITRMTEYLTQLETPTTWHNVRSYEAALVYIQNGRADQFSPSCIYDCKDLLYTNKLSVFLYDWEHKCWIDPSMYTIDTSYMTRTIENDCYDDYATEQVLYAIDIIPTSSMPLSRKLLVYFAYQTSDIYDTIPVHDRHCTIRMRPVLSLVEMKHVDAFYDKIRIRKHFDGNEVYRYQTYSTIPNFSKQGFLVHRPNRNGNQMPSPTMRFCDITLSHQEQQLDYKDLSLYLKFPFQDVITSSFYHIPIYHAIVNQPIDSFEEGKEVTLICVQNNANVSYDGNISNVIFEGVTSLDGETQQITITSSNLPKDTTGDFVCTVFKKSNYLCHGGLVTIQISNTSMNLMDQEQTWIRIPQEYALYKELPQEFVVVPTSNTFEFIEGETITITIENHYLKSTNDTMSEDQSSLYHPYEYYFDQKHEIRYPISNTRENALDKRLTIDTTLNPNISLIKSPYIGICRYSMAKIPKDGKIDLTGYLPTPLSRDRYEFWLNGRYLKDPDELIILSPTSIQLCNQTSLRNFEVIELVDDVYDSIITQKNNVYVDLQGTIFGSYESALCSNALLRDQSLKYRFNTLEHQKLHDVSSFAISNPNNQDIEIDILDLIKIHPSQLTSYRQLHHLPSINGIPITHVSTDQLGLLPAPIEDIIHDLDQVWKYELINDPYFMITHKDRTLEKQYQTLSLHVQKTEDGFMITATGSYTQYFTLYIANHQDTTIDDIENTVKIIPFIRTGISIQIESCYQHLWLHATFPSCKPIPIH